MQAYVICKNEEINIERCIQSLAEAGFDVLVLDSGSTDTTLEILRRNGVETKSYKYRNHCQTYNEITAAFDPNGWCLIVDADTVTSSALANEVAAAMDGGADVARAPVRMVHEGYRLQYASLYPPKPLSFRGGRAYFEPAGHGERLAPDVTAVTLREELIHDDRKPYEAFIGSQIRYGRALAARAIARDLTWRDKLRVFLPFPFVAPAFISFVLRRGSSTVGVGSSTRSTV